MTQQEIYNTIVTTVKSFLPETRVVLFGSRARGESNRGSDYDVLIITPNEYEGREKIEWRGRISNALVTAINAPFDVLMNSEKEIVKNQKLPGHVIHYAMKEGVVL